MISPEEQTAAPKVAKLAWLKEPEPGVNWSSPHVINPEEQIAPPGIARRAWSKEPEPAANWSSIKLLSAPGKEEKPRVNCRSSSKASANSVMSIYSIHSTRSSRSIDVPSLASLELVGRSASKPGEFERQVSDQSYFKRLQHQNVYGVPNARSLGGEEHEISALESALALIGPLILVVVVYAGLLCIWEFKYFIPYDSGFAIVLLWCGSTIGGQIALAVGLPPLLGMLCSGMLLKNAGDLVRGLPDSWGAAVRAFGLMNILMRGGLEMDLKAVRRLGPAAMRLTVLPGVSEALCVSGTASWIFGMPFALALALGFILGAVSPAVVVGGMFDLQSRGFGVKKGVPSLVVAAASFDDVVAISGFSMCIGLAVGHGNIVVEALHGPINILAGIGFGVLGAGIACMTKIWNTGWKRAGIVLGFGIIFTFLAKHLHYAGAGALASLVMAAVASQFWQHGTGGCLSVGADDHFAHEVELYLSKVWSNLAEPLLFSVIGAALDFGNIDIATIPKAVAVVVCGVILRTAAAYFATFGAGLVFKERLFIALAWMPKATVQAALGSVPLDLIKNEFNKEDDPSKYDRYKQHGIDILTTAVFAILITAPVGLIVIQQLGPRWLEHGYPEDTDDDAELQKPKTAPKQREAGPNDDVCVLDVAVGA